VRHPLPPSLFPPFLGSSPQTVGDAFMVVGGCPVPEPPEAAAARVAAMALDMVRTAESFRSSRGQRLRIRVGLASGSVAAAVIGKKM
jgi:class 3 adenylate cyclase